MSSRREREAAPDLARRSSTAFRSDLSSDHTLASSTERFLDKVAQEASAELYCKAALGKPSRIQRFSWKNLGAVRLAMVAFILAIVLNFEKGTAVYLGQIAQLILLGLMNTTGTRVRSQRRKRL